MSYILCCILYFSLDRKQRKRQSGFICQYAYFHNVLKRKTWKPSWVKSLTMHFTPLFILNLGYCISHRGRGCFDKTNRPRVIYWHSKSAGYPFNIQWIYWVWYEKLVLVFWKCSLGSCENDISGLNFSFSDQEKGTRHAETFNPKISMKKLMFKNIYVKLLQSLLICDEID